MYLKNPIDLQLKREFEETKMDNNESNNSSDANSEMSDLENSPDDNATTPLDYTDNALNLHPVADFIKKEFLPDFDFGNPFRNQMGFNQNRSPFLLPTQLYKSFLASLGKGRRNVADCYSLYPRNMLFSNGFRTETSDDENSGRNTDSPDEVITDFISK